MSGSFVIGPALTMSQDAVQAAGIVARTDVAAALVLDREPISLAVLLGLVVLLAILLEASPALVRAFLSLAVDALLDRLFLRPRVKLLDQTGVRFVSLLAFGV